MVLLLMMFLQNSKLYRNTRAALTISLIQTQLIVEISPHVIQSHKDVQVLMPEKLQLMLALKPFLSPKMLMLATQKLSVLCVKSAVETRSKKIPGKLNKPETVVLLSL